MVTNMHILMKEKKKEAKIAYQFLHILYNLNVEISFSNQIKFCT